MKEKQLTTISDMSRQEDFIEAGIEYRFKQGKPMAIGGDNFAEMARELNRNKVYEDGCEYGYQYAVEKLRTVLKQVVYLSSEGALQLDTEITNVDSFIDSRIQAMEE